MARAASRTPKRGVCATSAIRLTFGHGRDPVQMYMRKIVKSWFSRIAGNDLLQRRLARSRDSFLARVSQGWARV